MWLVLCVFCTSVLLVDAADMSERVLGSFTNFLPVAFGDYNNDKQTDVFLLHENRSMFEVALMQRADTPMLRRHNLTCSYDDLQLVTLMPSDYDGDGVMDIVVVARRVAQSQSHDVVAFAVWGDLTALNCLRRGRVSLEMLGQPLALDFDGDMATDLLAMLRNGSRAVWRFSRGQRTPHVHVLPGGPLRLPAVHAFADLSGDLTADLLLATDDGFELWQHGPAGEGWQYHANMTLPPGVQYVGQPVLLDLESSGRVQLVVPVCRDEHCVDTSLLLRANIGWLQVPLVFESSLDGKWGFPVPQPGSVYGETIVARVGDVNLDGYPDLVVSLERKDGETGSLRSFVLKNIACPTTEFCATSRAFLVQWSPLAAWSLSPAAAFFDVGEDGLLDVLVVQQSLGSYKVSVSGNEPGEDALFLKLTVIDGGCYMNCSHGVTVAYGTNRPGPAARGHIILTDGSVRSFSAVQLAQSGYQALQLPYTVFGLGRSPNFVDTLRVGVPRVAGTGWSGPAAAAAGDSIEAHTKQWTQLIPNSQLVVIPRPPSDPDQWINKLYVTPGETIISTLIALLATLAAIVVVVTTLHWRERRQDKLERMQQAHRFNFDAM